MAEPVERREASDDKAGVSQRLLHLIVCPSAALVVGGLESRRCSKGHGCASPTHHLQQKEEGHEERVGD